MTNECAWRCSNPCTTAAREVDGARRTRQYDQHIPCGMNRSAVQHMHFARGSGQRSDGLECRSSEPGGEEISAISSISIPNEVTRDLLPAPGLSELVGDPFGGRVRGHPKPQDLPPAVAHDQQSIEQPERDCRYDEEVHCGNAVSMVAKERLPSLRGRGPSSVPYTWRRWSGRHRCRA
jgi:hypothetical protein